MRYQVKIVKYKIMDTKYDVLLYIMSHHFV